MHRNFDRPIAVLVYVARNFELGASIDTFISIRSRVWQRACCGLYSTFEGQS